MLLKVYTKDEWGNKQQQHTEEMLIIHIFRKISQVLRFLNLFISIHLPEVHFKLLCLIVITPSNNKQ